MEASELSITNDPLDETDAGLLHRLMRQGRATWSDLAVELGLTAPAIAQRVRRLEDRGVIRHFTALVDPQALAPVAAFLSVRPAVPRNAEQMRRQLTSIESIQECHFLGGEHEHLLKVRCRSLGELHRLISEILPQAGAIVTDVRVVLSTCKETPVLPIGDENVGKKARSENVRADSGER